MLEISILEPPLVPKMGPGVKFGKTVKFFFWGGGGAETLKRPQRRGVKSMLPFPTQPENGSVGRQGVRGM